MKVDLYNADNLEVMKTLPNESIDVICIDPPYLYLKNQKLERPFDELKFFTECKRLLTKNGFIVMFGRGTSFYRWNTILEDLKFTFKEEVIWDKQYNSSPVLPISRVHETISVFCKGNSGINKVKVPYLESKKHDVDVIVGDIKRLKSVLTNSNELNAVNDFLKSGVVPVGEKRKSGSTTISKNSTSVKNVTASVCAMITTGMTEKSIIRNTHDRYSNIHPTQKPVRLLERLLKLVIPLKNKKIVVADWFSGSNSCCEAVVNLQSEFPDIEFQFIGTEIDGEYFEAGQERINKILYPEIYS